MEAVQPDRKDFKIQALLEKISSLVTNYENEVSDYRVEITLLTREVQRLREQYEDKDAEETQEEPRK